MSKNTSSNTTTDTTTTETQKVEAKNKDLNSMRKMAETMDKLVVDMNANLEEMSQQLDALNVAQESSARTYADLAQRLAALETAPAAEPAKAELAKGFKSKVNTKNVVIAVAATGVVAAAGYYGYTAMKGRKAETETEEVPEALSVQPLRTSAVAPSKMEAIRQGLSK